MLEHNAKLQGDVELLTRERDAGFKLEDLVQQLTAECGASKDRLMLADIRNQELAFEVEDLQDKIRQFEKKESYHRNQLEQLQAQFARTSSEFLVLKQEEATHASSNAKTAAQHDRLRETVLSLTTENKRLKAELETKFDAGVFEVRRQLEDETRQRKQLEKTN